MDAVVAHVAGDAAMRGRVLRHGGGHDREAHDAGEDHDGRADGDPERPVGDADETVHDGQDEGVLLSGDHQFAVAVGAVFEVDRTRAAEIPSQFALGVFPLALGRDGCEGRAIDGFLRHDGDAPADTLEVAFTGC